MRKHGQCKQGWDKHVWCKHSWGGKHSWDKWVNVSMVDVNNVEIKGSM